MESAIGVSSAIASFEGGVFFWILAGCGDFRVRRRFCFAAAEISKSLDLSGLVGGFARSAGFLRGFAAGFFFRVVARRGPSVNFLVAIAARGGADGSGFFRVESRRLSRRSLLAGFARVLFRGFFALIEFAWNPAQVAPTRNIKTACPEAQPISIFCI